MIEIEVSFGTIQSSGGGTATVPDAVEDNVVTFATEGQLKDSGKKIGGEEFGEYEQIPVREVTGLGSYNSEKDKVYGYYIDKTIDIVYKEKECLTAIGQTKYSAPTVLYYFNTEGDVNSGLSSTSVTGVVISSTTVHYLNGEKVINANTIATEKGVENFLTTFNLVTPKYKTGDVVYYSNYNHIAHIGVMPFEDYEKNPTNDQMTRFPIGLVADPVKRTFVFTDLIGQDLFVNTAYILQYLAGYTSYDNGQETAKRLSTIDGGILNQYFPAFYDLRYNPKMNGSCFYTKQENAYIPSLKEWQDVYSLCVGMYDASQMDKLICLKNGEEPAMGIYISMIKQFYAQTSSIGNSENLFPFNLVGNETSSLNSIWKCCPVFGIYTEKEENNYPEF